MSGNHASSIWAGFDASSSLFVLFLSSFGLITIMGSDLTWEQYRSSNGTVLDRFTISK
jgi:hypothetical protein